MIRRIINLLNNDDGTTAVEYCVLLALIVMLVWPNIVTVLL